MTVIQMTKIDLNMRISLYILNGCLQQPQMNIPTYDILKIAKSNQSLHWHINLNWNNYYALNEPGK